MNPDVVADTQAVVWYYFDHPRLSARALVALDAAAAAGRLYISAGTMTELVYLEERQRFPYAGVFARLSALDADPNEPLVILPITVEVAAAMPCIPRAEVPDLPDRIIAATAVVRRLPLVSADSDIRSSPALAALIPVIW